MKLSLRPRLSRMPGRGLFFITASLLNPLALTCRPIRPPKTTLRAHPNSQFSSSGSPQTMAALWLTHSAEPCTALCKGPLGTRPHAVDLGAIGPWRTPRSSPSPCRGQATHSTPNQASLSSPANLGLILPGATVGADPLGGLSRTGGNIQHLGWGGAAWLQASHTESSTDTI